MGSSNTRKYRKSKNDQVLNCRKINFLSKMVCNIQQKNTDLILLFRLRPCLARILPYFKSRFLQVTRPIIYSEVYNIPDRSNYLT